MICAMFVSQRWERMALWLTPLAAAPLLACFGFTDGWRLLAVVGLAGFLHGIGMPVFVSYGQQLLPAGERIANSITMGVSWGVSSGLAAISIKGFKQADSLPRVFLLFAAVSAVAGLLCLGLPRLDRPEDERRIGKVEA